MADQENTFARMRRKQRARHLLSELLAPDMLRTLAEIDHHDAREFVARFLCTYFDEGRSDALLEELDRRTLAPLMARAPGPGFLKRWVRARIVRKADDRMPEIALEPVVRRLLPELPEDIQPVDYLRP